jgi:hypothetical protein
MARTTRTRLTLKPTASVSTTGTRRSTGSLRFPRSASTASIRSAAPGTPSCRAKYADVNAAGGDATWLSLYDIGIYGNSHMMFWEKNNEEIAQVLLDWIEGHVERPRGKPGR